MKRKLFILLIIFLVIIISYFLWDYFRVIRKDIYNLWDVKYIEIDKKRDRVYVTLFNGKKYIVEYTCCHAIVPLFQNRNGEIISEIIGKPAKDFKFIDSKVVVYYKDGDYEIHDLKKEILYISIIKGEG